MVKLTDWYPPHVKPVRDGVYEVSSPDSGPRRFRMFSRGHWYCGWSTPDLALVAYSGRVKIAPETWRGIAK